MSNFRSNPGVIGLSDSLGIDPSALSSTLTLLEWNPEKHTAAFAHIVRAQAAVDALTDYAVKLARQDKKTWAEIGHMLGVTAQAAHKRFRHLDAK